ncbi:MAG TPA: cupin domain-containing protein [bacterium]|nr:cupin domain-containing protein [bacterium]
MPFYKWDTLPDEVISPHYSTATGGTVTGAVIEVGRYRMAAGTGAEPHKHPNEQIIYILQGRLRVRVAGEQRVVGVGEAVHFPPNVEHEVRALEDSLFLSSKNLVDGKGSKGWSAAAPVRRPRAASEAQTSARAPAARSTAVRSAPARGRAGTGRRPARSRHKR